MSFIEVEHLHVKCSYFPFLAASLVNGHSKRQYDESEDNSDNGRSLNESSAEESDEDLTVRQKSTRMTAKVAVSKIKQLNHSEEDENHSRNQRPKHQSSKQETRSSDEDEEPRAKKHPHQNGRKMEVKELKRTKLASESQEQASQSKLHVIQKKTSATDALTSTTQDSDELSDVPVKPFTRRKRIKLDEDVEENGDDAEEKSLRNRKRASNTRRKKHDEDSDVSGSEKSDAEDEENQSDDAEEISLRKRKTKPKTLKSDDEENLSDDEETRPVSKRTSGVRKKRGESLDVSSSESEEKIKEATSSDEWQQSDESGKEKKTYPRRRLCTKATSKRSSLRDIPKKNYIMEDSDEDLNSEVEIRSKHGKNNSRARKPSGDSKRKRGCTTDEDVDDTSRRTSDDNENSEHGRKNAKPSKRLRKGLTDSESSSETQRKSENGSLRGKRDQRSEKLPRDTQHQARHNRKWRQSESDEEESGPKSEEESDSETGSGSRSSPKRTLRGTARLRKCQRDVSDEDSEVSYGKPRRATRIRTRNRGKRTVNYQDSE